MGIYFTEESKNSFKMNSLKNGNKRNFFLPLYAGIVAVFLSLILMSLLIPIWLKDLSELEKLVDMEFSVVRGDSESAWRDLLQIESDDPSVSWARIRRQTSDEFSNYDYRPDSANNEAAYDGNGRGDSIYPATPISSSNYQNSYEQKCCCDLQSFITSGNIDSLPVSSHCKIGVKGPPGQRGPIGDAGYDGRPGRPGLDFNFYAARSTAPQGGYPQNEEEDPYSSIHANPYSSPPSASPRFCEPCPPGRPGPPGGPGRPGNPGVKGVEGPSGRHGLPGGAGHRGPTGDRGPIGRHGYGGIPGPNGADGIKGGVGAPGAKGQLGDTGLSGIRGPQGPDGNAGYIGRVGIRGPRGIKGQRGLDGIDGPPGRPGAPGDDGFYCPCPQRTGFLAGSEDFSNRQQSFERQSTAFAQPPRPVTPPSPPAIQRPFYQNQLQNQRNPNDYHRKIYVNEPIPIALRREFQPARPNPNFEEREGNAFVGRNVFTSTARPPQIPRKTWQTTNEEQTYGLDEDFINPRRRHHQIV